VLAWWRRWLYFQEKAERVVEARVLGEGAVPALVRDHPDAEQHAALQHPVERPGGEAERRRERRDARQREPQEAPGDGEVAEQVGGGPEERAPEAVRRHGAPDLRQREGRLVRRGPRHRGRRRRAGPPLLPRGLPLLLGRHPALRAISSCC